ncbi:MAG: hypothetical protein WCL18_00345 [bacterium]
MTAFFNQKSLCQLIQISDHLPLKFSSICLSASINLRYKELLASRSDLSTPAINHSSSIKAIKPRSYVSSLEKYVASIQLKSLIMAASKASLASAYFSHKLAVAMTALVLISISSHCHS